MHTLKDIPQRLKSGTRMEQLAIEREKKVELNKMVFIDQGRIVRSWVNITQG